MIDPKDVDIAKYREGMTLIAQSGIITFIKQYGAVTDQGIHAEMVNANFSEARRSFGFNQAINMLINFQQLFLAPKKEDVPMPHDYGALKSMLESGKITKEKYDELAQRPIFNPGK